MTVNTVKIKGFGNRVTKPVQLGQVVTYEIAFDPPAKGGCIVAYETASSGGVSTNYVIEGFGQVAKGGREVPMMVKSMKRGDTFTVVLTSRSKTPPAKPEQGVVLYGGAR
jgi:hypothetical protein